MDHIKKQIKIRDKKNLIYLEKIDNWKITFIDTEVENLKICFD